MNSLKIEMGAVLALKNVIQLNDLMKDYINDNDKEPSWDGHIYLYNSDDMKAENIRYKIPVQVKGKNDESLLKRERISFPVEYKHLRNYYGDGGVFYVVVVISDDRRKTTIFYDDLTTVKLSALLKKSEDKKPDQTKNIVLQKLKKNDDSLLFKVLVQFGFDREHQGSGNGEIIEKAININVLDKVDAIRVTSYLVTNEIEVLEKISTGELCLYGHRSDLDMWLPFDYEHQQEIQLKTVLLMNKSIGVDGKNYYDKYWVERMASGTPIIRVSKNLIIDLLGGKLNLEFHGNIEEIKKDVDFLYAVMNGTSFWVQNKKLSEYSDKNVPTDLQNKMEMITDFYNALKEINFICEKDFDDFNDEDWKSVRSLINIYHRNIKIKDDRNNEWCMWWWNGKVIPLLAVWDDDEIKIVNWLTKEGYVIFTEKESGEKFKLPRGIMFRRDVWEKLYEVDEEILLNDIENSDYSEKTLGDLYLFFVEILSAYDVTKNEKYYSMATLLIKKLLQVEEDNENGIINRLQLLKRKRELSEKEISELESLEEKTENDMIMCAINVLLDNKHKAKQLINKLSEADQEIFKNYPIYNLL